MVIWMKFNKVIDLNDYQETWRHSPRTAVRAIIFHDDKLVMVKSMKVGYYKFPGGGSEPGETHIDTLSREVYEEVGLTVIPASACLLGKVRELRKSTKWPELVFDHTSYYYLAKVSESVGKQHLDDYEKDLQFKRFEVDIKTAYEVNMQLGRLDGNKNILREAYVLSQVMKYKHLDQAFQTCCGVNCSDCDRYPNQCSGCLAIKGEVYWAPYLDMKVCPTYQCCINEKKLNHCGQCSKFPCQNYDYVNPLISQEEQAKVFKNQLVNLMKRNKKCSPL